MPSPQRAVLLTERVAYWCLRLNGFLTIENFLLHNRGGGNRTDADVVGVRFPHRREMALDYEGRAMADDERLGLSDSLVDFVVVEVKTGRCDLNGPWTAPKGENIHRLLQAMGPLATERVKEVADALYKTGLCVVDETLRIRLVAIGAEFSEQLAARFPDVKQITWDEALAFIHARFQQYRRAKTEVKQWADDGQTPRHLASNTRDRSDFERLAKLLMGVPQRRAPR